MLAHIFQLESQLLQSRKHANNLLSIIEILRENYQDFPVALRAVQATRTALIQYRKDGDLKYPRPSQINSANQRDNAEVFSHWIWKAQEKFESILLEGLRAPEEKMQIVCLNSLMTLAKMELDSLLEAKIDQSKREKFSLVAEFNRNRSSIMSRIIRTLLSPGTASKGLLKEYLVKYVGEFQDIRFFTLYHIESMLDEQDAHLLGKTFRENVFNVLMRYRISEQEDSENYVYYGDLCNRLSGAKRKLEDSEDAPDQTTKKAEFESTTALRKLISGIWMKVLAFGGEPLPQDLYKVFLMHIEEAVFRNFNNPLRLADFLTDSYEVGGIISILALNGLFYLINEHNFEYPNFYPKLFKLLEPSIFYTKHRDKFFALLYVFLKSSLLPAYMVGVFVKRLARLALYAPAASAIVCIRLIFNILRRHPQCRSLVQRTRLNSSEESCSASSYSFEDEDFSDPARIQKQLESTSLWEVKSLSKHYSPEVARESHFLLETSSWPSVDRELASILSVSFNDVRSVLLVMC
jgi:U3 small nucleolar RNA-associated protein 19